MTQTYSVVKFENNDGVLNVINPHQTKDSNSKHGLYRALVSNMVEGVSKGYTKELELVGVGYRASNQAQILDLALGFSHNIIFNIAPAYFSPSILLGFNNVVTSSSPLNTCSGKKQ